tara:strand:+ start:5108 stop:6670 length:1563 start_codon:yes stop_codon:yes gene_type:complete
MPDYNDPAKELSRLKLRRFISKEVLPYRRAKDVKILCFPGAEHEYDVALELLQVYDPLGIPRENIVGLENSHKRRKRLRKANLGIEISHKNALKYFTEHDKVFDVISLDYCGQKAQHIVDTVRKIGYKKLIRPPGVLAINTFAGREPKSLQDDLRNRHDINSFITKFQNNMNENSNLDANINFSGFNEEEFLESEEYTLQDTRDTFTQTLRSRIIKGLMAYSDLCGDIPYPIYRMYPHASDYELYEDKIVGEEAGEMHKTLMHVNYDYLHFRKHILDEFFPGIMEYSKEFNERYYVDKLSRCFMLICADTLMAENIETYRYSSLSGHRMEMDLFAVGNTRRHFNYLRRYLDCRVEGNDIVLRKSSFYQKNENSELDMLNRVLKYMREHYFDENDTIDKRIDLGSARAMVKNGISGKHKMPEAKSKRKYRRPVVKECDDLISLEDAVDLMKDGTKPGEITSCFRGVTKSELDKLYQKMHPQKQQKEKTIVMLLKEGVTPKEVHAQYSGYSVRRLKKIAAKL